MYEIHNSMIFINQLILLHQPKRLFTYIYEYSICSVNSGMSSHFYNGPTANLKILGGPEHNK